MRKILEHLTGKQTVLSRGTKHMHALVPCPEPATKTLGQSVLGACSLLAGCAGTISGQHARHQHVCFPTCALTSYAASAVDLGAGVPLWCTPAPAAARRGLWRLLRVTPSTLRSLCGCSQAELAQYHLPSSSTPSTRPHSIISACSRVT
jgi:hypothetical protein